MVKRIGYHSHMTRRLPSLFTTHSSLAVSSSCLARQNEFNSNKTLNHGTFSRFKCFHTPYRTRDMKRKIQNFPSWNLRKKRIGHHTLHVGSTRLLPLRLQFARKNWISTSASIDAQYSFGTTLVYVNLPRLWMVLVRLEDVSLGPEPCTLLFINLLRDEPVLREAWTHWKVSAGKFRGFQWQH